MERTDTTFDVSIVAFTMENTVMCNRIVGDAVNFGIRCMAKYIVQFNKMGVPSSNITFDFFRKTDFYRLDK
jgi:riboflavin synthase alpha subunit